MQVGSVKQSHRPWQPIFCFFFKFKGRKKIKEKPHHRHLDGIKGKSELPEATRLVAKRALQWGKEPRWGVLKPVCQPRRGPTAGPCSALTCDPSLVEVSRSACLAREGKQVSRRCIPLIIHHPLVDTFTSENIYGPGSVSRVHNSCAYICTQAHY